ncbi:protein kinase (plasmid) [Mycolicibacterium crocinum]|uniref:non-specific serine/threonine protein kinase n=1 Tax=Mycolicibacterium crocinum TaxID=388459 RepID=A0ABY3TT52_9MYCO|nr:serine/threonine-protein kinase [Mycolicibacterium crocinum]ULN44682.1 protein kinase [Mycolicibacterium crocinum]
MPLSPGSVFAGYRVECLLGAGGMGEVYRVAHPRMGRREAMKVLPADVSADQEYRQRFVREADLAASLWHPHIVGVHDRGECDAQLWITMDYVEGTDLGAQLRQRYPAGMPAHEVAAVIAAVAEALDYAHSRGLMHRDIKPANIMITTPTDGSPPRVLLTDFGIARNLNDISGLTMTNMTVGTVAYAAPEQLRGDDIDGRADQYALAATAYHLLTGTKLFDHSNPVAVISAHLSSPPPLPGQTRPDLAALDPILARALSKHPHQRFARCNDFATALTAQIADMTADPTATATPTHHTPTGQPWDAEHSPSWTPPPAASPPDFAHSWAPEIAVRPAGRRRRRLLVIGAVAAVLAAVASVIGVRAVTAHNKTQHIAAEHQAAREAGERYVQALASGDAATALSLSASAPADTHLLTDAVLKAGLASLPVTNISVTNLDPVGTEVPTTERLHLAATFGSQPSQADVTVRKSDGKWKLDATTVQVPLGPPGGGPNEGLRAVGIGGLPSLGGPTLTLFPGLPPVDSANKFVDVSAEVKPLLLESVAGASAAPILPSITLNDTGRQAVLDALEARARYCFHGGPYPPDCCPNGSCQKGSRPGTTVGAVDVNTFNLTKVVSIGGAAFELDPATMIVTMTGGAIEWLADVQRSDGTGIRKDYSVTLYLTGKKINIGADPPVWVPTPMN